MNGGQRVAIEPAGTAIAAVSGADAGFALSDSHPAPAQTFTTTTTGTKTSTTQFVPSMMASSTRYATVADPSGAMSSTRMGALTGQMQMLNRAGPSSPCTRTPPARLTLPARHDAGEGLWP